MASGSFRSREGGREKKEQKLKLLQPCLPSCTPSCLVSTSWLFPGAHCEEAFSGTSTLTWVVYYLIALLGLQPSSHHCRPPHFLLLVVSSPWHIALLDEVLSKWLEPSYLLWFHFVYGKLTHPYPSPASLWGPRLPCVCSAVMGSSHQAVFTSLRWKEPILILVNLQKLLGPHLGFSQEIFKSVAFPNVHWRGFYGCFSSAGLREENVVSPVYR